MARQALFASVFNGVKRINASSRKQCQRQNASIPKSLSPAKRLPWVPKQKDQNPVRIVAKTRREFRRLSEPRQTARVLKSEICHLQSSASVARAAVGSGA